MHFQPGHLCLMTISLLLSNQHECATILYFRRWAFPSRYIFPVGSKDEHGAGISKWVSAGVRILFQSRSWIRGQR